MHKYGDVGEEVEEVEGDVVVVAPVEEGEESSVVDVAVVYDTHPVVAGAAVAVEEDEGVTGKEYVVVVAPVASMKEMSGKAVVAVVVVVSADHAPVVVPVALEKPAVAAVVVALQLDLKDRTLAADILHPAHPTRSVDRGPPQEGYSHP